MIDIEATSKTLTLASESRVFYLNENVTISSIFSELVVFFMVVSSELPQIHLQSIEYLCKLGPVDEMKEWSRQ